MKRRIFAIVLTGLVLYGVAPAVLEVLGAFDDLNEIRWEWWIVVVVTQAAGLACFWEVQRIALHTREWFGVITSNLAAGALGRVVPGGAAAAAALQFQMLRRSDVGTSRGTTAAGLTAGSLLLVATLAVLPVLAIPAVIGGAKVPRTLQTASLFGLAVFAALFALGAVLMRSDVAVVRIGRAAAWVVAKLRRSGPPGRQIPARLLAQRNQVRQAMGERWPLALAAAAGRWLFDFLTLLAALEAVGARPRFSLALIAYCAAQLLAQIPLTPGGLGVVEAGMTGTLALIGVPAGAAALATLAYRLGSYWLQLPAGLVAWLVYRSRLGPVLPAEEAESP